MRAVSVKYLTIGLSDIQVRSVPDKIVMDALSSTPSVSSNNNSNLITEIIQICYTIRRAVPDPESGTQPMLPYDAASVVVSQIAGTNSKYGK